MLLEGSTFAWLAILQPVLAAPQGASQLQTAPRPAQTYTWPNAQSYGASTEQTSGKCLVDAQLDLA